MPISKSRDSFSTFSLHISFLAIWVLCQINWHLTFLFQNEVVSSHGLSGVVHNLNSYRAASSDRRSPRFHPITSRPNSLFATQRFRSHPENVPPNHRKFLHCFKPNELVKAPTCQAAYEEEEEYDEQDNLSPEQSQDRQPTYAYPTAAPKTGYYAAVTPKGYVKQEPKPQAQQYRRAGEKISVSVTIAELAWI